MLKNEPTLAIVAVHTAENEPLKILGVIHFNFQFGPYLRAEARKGGQPRCRAQTIISTSSPTTKGAWLAATRRSSPRSTRQNLNAEQVFAVNL